MKNLLRAMTAILLVIVMTATMAGCGDKQDPQSGVNDGFFTDEESRMSQSTDSGATSSSSDSGSTAPTSSVRAENTVNGKSWNQVLSSMPKELRGTTVTIANWNPMSEYTGASATIKEFQKQTGIKVDWQTIQYGIYTTRLASMVASGNAPDVARTRTPNPAWMQSFQPLSAAGYDFTDAAWDQTLMKDYTVNGVTYATSLKGTHIGSVNMMFYNKDLISKYDFEDPYTLWKNGKWTMSKFISMCKEYKKVSNANFGCTGAYWEGWSELYGIAGPVGYDGNQYYSNLSNSTFVTATQQIADWYNKDKLLGWGRAEVFDASESLFYAGASVYLRRNNSYFGNLKSAGTLYAVPMPSVDGQSTYYQGRDEYEAYALVKGAKNAKTVPYFLRYFLDGSHYDLDSFFCNKQNLEVYNWCMSQTNTIWSTNYESAEDTFGDGKQGLLSLQGSQIKSFLDSNAGMIDTRVRNFNNLVKQLQK